MTLVDTYVLPHSIGPLMREQASEDKRVPIVDPCRQTGHGKSANWAILE